jgi:uncharacterized tellurite resistance protein B-like protein
MERNRDRLEGMMDERVVRCHLVAAVLAADGMMREEEREFLRAYMDRAELSPQERDGVEHFEGSERAIEAARQLSPETRRALLDDVLAAALVDGVTNPLEMRLVKRLSEVLDVTRE